MGLDIRLIMEIGYAERVSPNLPPDPLWVGEWGENDTRKIPLRGFVHVLETGKIRVSSSLFRLIARLF